MQIIHSRAVRATYASHYTLLQLCHYSLQNSATTDPRSYTHMHLHSRASNQAFVGVTVRSGVWNSTVGIGPEGYAAMRSGECGVGF